MNCNSGSAGHYIDAARMHGHGQRVQQLLQLAVELWLGLQACQLRCKGRDLREQQLGSQAGAGVELLLPLSWEDANERRESIWAQGFGGCLLAPDLQQL